MEGFYGEITAPSSAIKCLDQFGNSAHDAVCCSIQFLRYTSRNSKTCSGFQLHGK